MKRLQRRPRLAMALLFVSAALAGGRTGTARAEDDEALIRQGIEQRRLGQDLKALELFQRAVAIKKTPRAVAQMALAEQAVGLWAKAEEDMKAAFALPADAWTSSHRKALDSALAVIEDHLGTLELWGEPAGAEVRVQDQAIGKLPDTGAVRVAVGPATASVRAPGYTPWSRVFEIKKSEFVKEHVQLTPVSAVAPVGAPPAASLSLAVAPPPAAVSGPGLGQPAAAADASEQPLYRKWWFWTVVGAVAVGGAVTAFALTRKSSTACDPPNCWQ